MVSEELLQNLIETTRKNISKVLPLKENTLEVLNWKSSKDNWSILECFEHLNRYGDFYIPEITQQIKTSGHKYSERFKSGWLGNYFAKAMLPKEKMTKMKTFTSMNPSGSNLNKEVIHKFIIQQHSLINILEIAKNVNLNKTKTKISISKWIKLKLGDTFRIVIYHNQRHIFQAEKILQETADHLV